MPKRSYDTCGVPGEGNVPPAKVQKAERSHEENQERAYIAASRRTDRSLEARVQSAKMASDIHRKRTGRGLRVSEEIVVKEEMYEEMEDEMPRHYKYLTAHLETSSPEMNHRLSAYVASQAAMAAIAKYNDIDKQFNEAFPRIASYSQVQNSLFGYGMPNNHTSPSMKATSPEASAMPFGTKNHAVSTRPYRRNTDISMAEVKSEPTPELSPTTTTSDAPEPTRPHMTPTAFSHLVDPQLTQQPTSSFTSDLSNEIKMLANPDMNDPMSALFFPDDTSSGYPMFDECDRNASAFYHHDSRELNSQEFSKTANSAFQPFSPDFGSSNVDGNRLLPTSDSFLQETGSTAPANDGWETFESFVDFDN
ncbi:hypothetical protein F4808DRAFT_405426 [Astrocystis sublimbata]|nr:hypothetical protein F4808DRAFT_405426 [Astrocystis sublimbata]